MSDEEVIKGEVNSSHIDKVWKERLINEILVHIAKEYKREVARILNTDNTFETKIRLINQIQTEEF